MNFWGYLLVFWSYFAGTYFCSFQTLKKDAGIYVCEFQVAENFCQNRISQNANEIKKERNKT